MSYETVAACLKSKQTDLVVPKSSTLVLDPAKPDTPGFHRVRVERFEDLELLRLIPAGLTEHAVRAAITADDTQALAVARRRLPSATDVRCSCAPENAPHGQGTAILGNYRKDLAVAYRQVRNTVHPSLATTLSDTTGLPVLWNDVKLNAVYRLWRRFQARQVLELLLWQLRDVEIMNHAQLVLARNVSAIYGNALRIHTDGKLVITGSWVHLRFVSAQGNLR